MNVISTDRQSWMLRFKTEDDAKAGIRKALKVCARKKYAAGAPQIIKQENGDYVAFFIYTKTATVARRSKNKAQRAARKANRKSK